MQPRIAARHFKEEFVIGEALTKERFCDDSTSRMRNENKVIFWCKEKGMKPKAISKLIRKPLPYVQRRVSMLKTKKHIEKVLPIYKVQAKLYKAKTLCAWIADAMEDMDQ